MDKIYETVNRIKQSEGFKNFNTDMPLVDNKIYLTNKGIEVVVSGTMIPIEKKDLPKIASNCNTTIPGLYSQLKNYEEVFDF